MHKSLEQLLQPDNSSVRSTRTSFSYKQGSNLMRNNQYEQELKNTTSRDEMIQKLSQRSDPYQQKSGGQRTISKVRFHKNIVEEIPQWQSSYKGQYKPVSQSSTQLLPIIQRSKEQMKYGSEMLRSSSQVLKTETNDDNISQHSNLKQRFNEEITSQNEIQEQNPETDFTELLASIDPSQIDTFIEFNSEKLAHIYGFCKCAQSITGKDLCNYYKQGQKGAAIKLVKYPQIGSIYTSMQNGYKNSIIQEELNYNNFVPEKSTNQNIKDNYISLKEMDYKFHTQTRFNRKQFQAPKDNIDIGKYGPFTKESMNQKMFLKFDKIPRLTQNPQQSNFFLGLPFYGKSTKQTDFCDHNIKQIPELKKEPRIKLYYRSQPIGFIPFETETTNHRYQKIIEEDYPQKQPLLRPLDQQLNSKSVPGNYLSLNLHDFTGKQDIEIKLESDQFYTDKFKQFIKTKIQNQQRTQKCLK